MQAVDMLSTLLVPVEAMNNGRVVTMFTLSGPTSADAGAEALTLIALKFEIRNHAIMVLLCPGEKFNVFTCKRMNSELAKPEGSIIMFLHSICDAEIVIISTNHTKSTTAILLPCGTVTDALDSPMYTGLCDHQPCRKDRGTRRSALNPFGHISTCLDYITFCGLGFKSAGNSDIFFRPGAAPWMELVRRS